MRSRWGATTESLELVRCHNFIGPPGSGASLAQPFEVVVDSQVSNRPRAHPPSPNMRPTPSAGSRSHPHASKSRAVAHIHHVSCIRTLVFAH